MKFIHTMMPFSRLALVVLLISFSVFEPVQGQESGVDPEKAGRFDNGKMWTFDHPPLDYFEEAYDFRPDAAWFEKARLGALRIPGCTASFVSSYGLVLTNHHCGRNAVTQVSAPGELLTENGFYAASLEDERRVPGYYADQLVAIEDITSAVIKAEEAGETDAERVQARQDTIAVIKSRLLEEMGGEDAGYVIEVIPLYHGGQYSAYTFKRYDDVRLVLTPELQLGYYGGDEDNFTFPRYSLDMTFFRVYDGDQPFEPENYFLWSMEGTNPGDAVFVIGNPGSTSRLESVAQLELRRDMTDKNLLAFINSHIKALRDYQANASTMADKNAVRNQLFSLLNAQKAYNGQLKALNDPVIMARRRDAEKQFSLALKDIDLTSTNADDVDGPTDILAEMAAVQKELLTLKAPHAAFLLLTSNTFSSALMRRAMLAHSYLDRLVQSESPDQLASLKEQLAGIGDMPEGLDVQFLTTRLKDISAAYGPAHELVKELLNDKEAGERAVEIIAQSVLASQAQLKTSLEEGTLSSTDPALEMVAGFMEAYRDFQSAFAGLNARQTDIASKIGRARFAVYGTDVPPDATFSLRIADGVVQGYPYNGTYASPYTSFYGLYDRFHSFGPNGSWALPEQWQDPPASFDLAVPMNFASTNDIIGGNSGSPIVNKDLELVGVIFDGNIESLAGNYIYLPELTRAVSVDARGMLEVLDEIYEADRLVEELANDVLISTEAEADSRQ